MTICVFLGGIVLFNILIGILFASMGGAKYGTPDFSEKVGSIVGTMVFAEFWIWFLFF